MRNAMFGRKIVGKDEGATRWTMPEPRIVKHNGWVVPQLQWSRIHNG